LTEVTEGTGIVLERLDRIGIALEAGLRNRLRHVDAIGAEADALLQGLAADEHASGWYILIIIGSVLAAGVAFLGVRRLLDRVAVRPGRSSLVLDAAAAILAFVVVAVLIRLSIGEGTVRHVARICALTTVLGLLVSRLIGTLLARDGDRAQPHLASFARILSLAFAWGMAGLATLATLRAWNAGPGLRDVTGTFIVSVPVTVLLILAYWRHRKAVAMAVAGPEPVPRGRKRFASTWPGLAIMAILGTTAVLQVAATMGHSIPGVAMLGTLLLVLVAPHVDSRIEARTQRKAADPATSLLSDTLRRMARFSFATLVLGLLGYLWALPALTALGFDVTLIRERTVEITVVALVGALLWNATAAGIERLERRDHSLPVSSDEEDGHAPRTRLETLLPLLGGTAKVTILILSLLTILVILNVNVWPLITGLSVFGLAIGFGSQTLVKDIVSGLFFLLDDAFRLGEYIETSGAKGTVERISVRSVSLRHPRGAVATIPYGQIGKIQNYSRDWVIEKLVFRVAFDTDVEKVRKLFKRIGQEIADNPELNADLLEPFKSQGIFSVEDGTLVLRGKFKARAGRQFAIRKVVLAAVQRTFRDNGIVAVPRPLPLPATDQARTEP
jgi:small-conductance mechanosensitive channel